MNLRDLKYLTTVAAEMHFGRAAQRCCISQPTLSTQLKKLEDELGVTLFERTNKQVFITNIGKVIIEQANLILRETDQLREMAIRSKDPLAGPLKLGIIPTLAPYFLPHIMTTLKESLPQTEFFLREDLTDRILQSLRTGDLDAIILAIPIENDQGLTTLPLFDEAFNVALPAQHPLSQKKAISLKDLKNETVLLLEDGHCLRKQALDICHLSGAYEKTNFRSTSLETLRYMVMGGTGITFLPQLAADKEHHSHLHILPFTDPKPKRKIAMLWRKSSPKNQCCEKIAEIIIYKIRQVL